MSFANRALSSEAGQDTTAIDFADAIRAASQRKRLAVLELLVRMAARKPGLTITDGIVVTDRFQIELPDMLHEREEIVTALEAVATAAEAHGRPEYGPLAERLVLHARAEVSDLCPGAILIGKWLRSQKSGMG